VDFVRKGVVYALDMLWIDSKPGIANRDEDAIRLRLLGVISSSQPRLDRAHCLGCVQHRVRDDLLYLSTIPQGWSEPARHF
jgi:hypothetical protein